MRLPYDSLSAGTRSVRFGLICGSVAAGIVVVEFLRLATTGGSTDMMITLVDGFLCGISAALSVLGLVVIAYGLFRGAPRPPAVIGLLLCWLVLTGLLGFLLAT